MGLKARILSRAIVYPIDPTKFFIPDGVLDELLDEASVMTELSGLHHTRSVAADGALVSKSTYHRILGTRDGGLSFKKIFAILVLIEKADTILDFTENSIDDSRLPLHSEPGTKSLFYITNENTYGFLSFTWDWNWSVSSSFLRKQWAFLAPTFKSTPETICHHQLSEDHILPITYSEGPTVPGPEKVQGEMIRHLGDFGDLPEVTKVRLHPQHYKFQDYPVRVLC